MEFVIIDRNERQWIASLEGKSGAPIPAKFNRFFVRRATIEKEFNGSVMKRDEWVIRIDNLEDLLELRSIAPNNSIYVGNLWDHPAVFL